MSLFILYYTLARSVEVNLTNPTNLQKAHFQQKIHVFSVQATLKGEEKQNLPQSDKPTLRGGFW